MPAIAARMRRVGLFHEAIAKRQAVHECVSRDRILARRLLTSGTPKPASGRKPGGPKWDSTGMRCGVFSFQEEPLVAPPTTGEKTGWSVDAYATIRVNMDALPGIRLI